MNFWILLIGALVFALSSAASWFFMQRHWPDAGTQRLQASRALRTSLTPTWSDRLPPRILKGLAWLSHWSLRDTAKTQAPQPSGDSAPTPLGLLLVQAGWRSRHAMWVYGGIKTSLMALLPALMLSLAWGLGLTAYDLSWWFTILAAAAAGYWLPDGVLRWRVHRHQQSLLRAFPDALDLLRVCVQAGLGLDAAIERVGREMRLASPLLSQEWRLTGLELRAGASRAMALRHMAERVGLAEIDALVTMLVQADRFGTRMSDALQVHADSLRTQRRLKAEEAAAKLPVKLLIPLVFCIFPALLTVMLGPVAISLYHLFSKQL